MKIFWFGNLLIFAFRTSRQGSSPLRSIISVIDHPEGGYSTVVLHKNYVLGVLWSLNSIQTQYKRFWSILVDTNIKFSHQNPDFGSQICKLFFGPSLKKEYSVLLIRDFGIRGNIEKSGKSEILRLFFSTMMKKFQEILVAEQKLSI